METGVEVGGWTLSMETGGRHGKVDSVHGDWGGSGRVAGLLPV